jgi:hypothetical protein
LALEAVLKNGDSSLALGMTISVLENRKEEGRFALGKSSLLFSQKLK